MDRFLTIEALSCRIGKSTAWIRKSIRDGLFPRPLAGCRGRWAEDSIRDWVEAKDMAAAKVLVARSSWPRPQLETR